MAASGIAVQTITMAALETIARTTMAALETAVPMVVRLEAATVAVALSEATIALHSEWAQPTAAVLPTVVSPLVAALQAKVRLAAATAVAIRLAAAALLEAMATTAVVISVAEDKFLH